MTLRPLGAALLLSVSGIALSTAASADPSKSCDNRSNNTINKITTCVTLDGVRSHQADWQAIADANGGNRASGFPGYDATVDDVVAKLTAAGYEPVVQDFEFAFFDELEPATLEQVSPDSQTYVSGVDFDTMSYSGNTDAMPVSGPVEAVDLDLGLGNSSTSGCEIEDFSGFTAGSIALLQRGACSFQQKVENAEASGAIGAIIFNQGNEEGREVLFGGTLSADYSGDLPVVSATYALGEALAALDGAVLALATDTVSGVFTTYNVIAETASGDPDNVVMVGAHLDSVLEWPGIQDNGTGSAAILETAIQLADTNLRNKVRFGWWGAEEAGLVESYYYVDQLSEEEIEDIALYLNFDMIGSPNYVFKIYDGDDSDGVGAGAGPDGSGQIEAFFEDFYEAKDESYKGTDFSGRSDYAGFIEVGIPAGGLFTGAEEIKTEEEAEIWGGTPGEQLDPCYHDPCDTFDNISLKAFAINSDAVAAATLYFAMNLSEINGSQAKGNFRSAERALSKVDASEMDYLGPQLAR